MQARIRTDLPCCYSLLHGSRVVNDPGVAMGRLERRKEATRKALLDAAKALFLERGVHATRLEDVTERADLGKGAFYNYFDSKDALVAVVVGEGADRLERDYLRRVAGASVAERVAAVVREHYAFFRDHREYVMLFHHARGLLKVRSDGAASVRLVFQRYLESVGAVLVPGGDPRVGRRRDLAALVVGSIAGYLSFCMAAGLEANPRTVELALSGGVERALAGEEPPP